MVENKFAVVYARYSSHRQGEQSIEGQQAAAHKYAAENGLTIIHEYIDRAMTGRNDNRAQFQQMLKDAGKGQFGTIILWKVDRFGRNREEIAFNKYRCKKSGVKVVYVAEIIPDSPEGVILESVLEGMAEYYSKQLSQNILRGIRASAEKGQSLGGNRPLGYLTGPDKKLVIDADTAPTVRLIFDRYAAGATCAEIIKALNQKGLRTLQGKPFNKNSINRILRNEKYIGVYAYKDEIRIENAIPPLVDVETFYKVQEMLKVNKRKPIKEWNYADYILTDKLFCGKCGELMVGESGTSRNGNVHNYYTCTKKRRQRACDKKSVRQDWIEELVLNRVHIILYDDKLLDLIADAVYTYYTDQNSNQEFEDALNRKLKEVETATANIIKAIEAGIINDATKKRMAELDAQRLEITAELADLKLTQSIQLTRDQILFFLYAFRNGNFTDREFQKRIIDTFVNAVFVYDDEVTLTFNYSGDGRTITLKEVDAQTNDGVFVPCCGLSTIKG
jgi:DNA invertase Pin-like site-specific DNA recombinase